MNTSNLKNIQEGSLDAGGICRLIARTQKKDGEIPWHTGGKTDPWDHVEAAMGLAIGGYYEQARNAFEWLRRIQRPDGSWYASYIDGVPEDRTLDANLTAYVAVGVFHHYLITGDLSFLEEMWRTVDAAIDFALRLQAPGGEIHWAISPEGRTDPMALLTGSCSVYMSLKCARIIARHLDREKPVWGEAMLRLEEALRFKPHLFNITKSRFSMDWFYPVLTGILTGESARQRIQRYWKKFIVNGQGVKCVSDEPWVTLAETAELVLALSAMGDRRLAQTVFGWILDKQFGDHTFWCGYTHPDMVVWPEEKITWTNAVVLMAADALYDLTPAGRIFNHEFWSGKLTSGAL